jgi:hypothetical protein
MKLSFMLISVFFCSQNKAQSNWTVCTIYHVWLIDFCVLFVQMAFNCA